MITKKEADFFKFLYNKYEEGEIPLQFYGFYGDKMRKDYIIRKGAELCYNKDIQKNKIISKNKRLKKLKKKLKLNREIYKNELSNFNEYKRIEKWVNKKKLK